MAPKDATPGSSPTEIRYLEAPPLAFFKAHEAKTRHWVTVSLLGLLGLTIVAHYVAVAIVYCAIDDQIARRDALTYLSEIFRTCLPAEVGLVGAATAFYFTDRRR